MDLFFRKMVLFPLVLSVCTSACGEATEAPLQTEGRSDTIDCGEVLASSKDAVLPNDVLIGTDVAALSDFASSSSLAVQYSTEIGGARLSLSVTPFGKHHAITRTYEEPGLPVEEKTYSPVCVVGERVVHQNLQGRLVDGGMLLLEYESEVMMISDDLWFFYQSTDSVNNGK